MFCKHEWEKVNQFETKSMIEVAKDAGVVTTKVYADSFDKKYITDYICKKCGKLKRFIVEN